MSESDPVDKSRWNPKVGDRVGAYISRKDITYFFGPGVYAGDYVPPLDLDPSDGFQIAVEGTESIDVIVDGYDASYDDHKNPRIDLDSGGSVWGYECWWRPEHEFPEALGTGPVRRVTIGEYRKLFVYQLDEN